MKRNNVWRLLGFSLLVVVISVATNVVINNKYLNNETFGFADNQIPASYANFKNASRAGDTDFTVAAELTGAYLSMSQTNNGFIFNIMAPIERILTLMLYAKNYKNKSGKQLAYTGILLVIAIAVYGIFHFPTFQEFHYGTYVVSGLVIAVASYLHLRAIALDKAGQSFIIFVFSLANLVYFTLMISSLSAYGLANQIDNNFGSFELGKKPGVNLITGVDFKKMKLTESSRIKRLI